MSTNTQCDFIEHLPSEWYLFLERYEEDEDGQQEPGETDVYGPFDSFEQAETYLNNNHANPGGYCKSEYDAKAKPSEAMKKMIDGAISPRSSRYRGY